MAERSAEEDRALLAEAYSRTGLRVEELWLAFFALGGNAGRDVVEAYLAGLTPLDSHQHDVLAHAVNEELAERSTPLRAPYRTTGE